MKTRHIDFQFRRYAGRSAYGNVIVRMSGLAPVTLTHYPVQQLAEQLARGAVPPPGCRPNPPLD